MIPEFFLTYLEHFSYLGFFLALALTGYALTFPEDILLLAIGYIVSAVGLNLEFAIIASFAGALVSDFIMFSILHHGRRFFSRQQSFFRIPQKFKDFFSRHTNRAIFVFRFVPGLRLFGFALASGTETPAKRFMLWDGIAAAIVIPIVVSVGYFFEDQIAHFARYAGAIRHYILIGTLVLAAVIIAKTMYARLGNSEPKNEQ